KEVYPDAVANVVHGYAHLYDDSSRNEETNEVIEVSSTTKKAPFTSDDDYEEDPFFRVLLHNNDDDDSVVNVSSKETDERVDNALFEKLHHKVFDREEKGAVESKKISYGIREFLADSAMLE
ncbi:hypothetical protein ACHAXS_013179, partial [Conticribra weissflogii]